LRRALVLGLVLASSVVVASGSPAAAVDCSTLRNWNDFTGTTQYWEDFNLWDPTGIPGDSDPDEFVCLNTTDTVFMDAEQTRFFDIGGVQMGGETTLDIREGAGLFVHGVDESVWASGTTTDVTKAQLGGSGTIRVQGDITFTSDDTSGTFLTSKQTVGNGEAPPADTGTMVVEGQATLSNLGLGLLTGYEVTVANNGKVTVAPNAFFAADYGTSTTIDAGGTLDFTGDGAYYQGFAVANQPLSVLTNNGTLVKSGGTGTSVVDADYVQGATGKVIVQSGTLALPDDALVSAQVAPGTSFATGTCGGQPSAVCQPTTNPTEDAMSVDFTVPPANGAPATVELQELPPVGPAVDPNGIGNEVLAHADNLVANPAGPATLKLRFSQADVMATPVSEVQVVHTPDSGPAAQIPLCVSGALPTGVPACLLSVTRDSQNTYVTVMTTQTSRWRVRRGQVVEPPPPPPGIPSAPQGLSVHEADPFDGSALAVAWSAPASSGGSAVTAYRVSLDGKQVATPAGTSTMLKNPGPGKHQVSVAAVNTAGAGPAAVADVSVADLSKPRKVEDMRGAPGGKLTAGATWKAPADAGGLALTGYKIAVFKANGQKLDIEVLKPAKLKFLFKLKPGRYFFKVRAHNADRWGPWSKPTDLVRPR
jgi:hypothetical protein